MDLEFVATSFVKPSWSLMRPRWEIAASPIRSRRRATNNFKAEQIWLMHSEKLGASATQEAAAEDKLKMSESWTCEDSNKGESS